VANRFVPEADALDQQREVAPSPGDERPSKMPLYAPETDVLEQSQAVDVDDEWR
jgi:hypothetical protein